MNRARCLQQRPHRWAGQKNHGAICSPTRYRWPSQFSTKTIRSCQLKLPSFVRSQPWPHQKLPSAVSQCSARMQKSAKSVSASASKSPMTNSQSHSGIIRISSSSDNQTTVACILSFSVFSFANGIEPKNVCTGVFPNQYLPLWTPSSL